MRTIGISLIAVLVGFPFSGYSATGDVRFKGRCEVEVPGNPRRFRFNLDEVTHPIYVASFKFNQNQLFFRFLRASGTSYQIKYQIFEGMNQTPAPSKVVDLLSFTVQTGARKDAMLSVRTDEDHGSLLLFVPRSPKEPLSIYIETNLGSFRKIPELGSRKVTMTSLDYGDVD